MSCEDSVKSKDINDTNVSGDQFFKHLLNKQPDVCDSSNINNQTPRTSSPSGAVNEVAENKVQHISQKPKLPANHLTAVKSVSKCDSTDVGESVSNREETPRIFDVAQLIYDCKTLEENYLKDGHLQQVEINGRTNENNYETSASCDIQEVQKVEKEKVDVSCIAMGEDSALELNKKGVEAGTLVIGTAVSSGDACVQTANVLLDNSPCQMPSECNTEVNNFPNDCHFELIPVLSIEDGCVIDGLITHIESPLSFHFHILTSDYKISFLNSDLR